MPGIVVFDNSALAAFHEVHTLERVLRSFRAVDLTPVATTQNLIEAFPAPPRIRDALFRILAELARTSGLLPSAYELLRLDAQAQLRGQSSFPIQWFEVNMDLTEQQLAEIAGEAREFALCTNEAARELHAGARPIVQSKLAESGLRNRWTDLASFLRDFWQVLDLREVFVDRLWRRLGLPEPRPADLLARSETWRLMIDGDGAQVFQGAVAFTQPKQVQYMDLLQLPYMAGIYQRILVTRDGPFADASRAILRGRYPGSRVCSPNEIIQAAT